MLTKISKNIITSLKMVYAGIMIAIAATVYMNSPNRVVGAFLFSVGLITIINFSFPLYTGRIGSARKPGDFAYCLLIFALNGVGCLFTLAVPANGAAEIMIAKLSCPPIYAFTKGIICGIIIEIAVRMKDNFATALLVPAFILCGAEHSVADLCFAFAAREFSIKAAIFTIIVMIGNAIGSLSLSLLLSASSKADFSDWDERLRKIIKLHKKETRC